MRTLPLTVLLAEGPIGRAYLVTLRRAGLRPHTILLMVSRTHPATRKPVGRWLPGGVRLAYAERVQESALNYWPRRIRQTSVGLYSAMVAGVEPWCAAPGAVLEEMFAPMRYEAYAERVERVGVDTLVDPALQTALARMEQPTVLFTGGGIVPGALLDMPDCRFVHMHPGHLPDVRGADGLLWSVLVRGRPGVSCFYMAKGLDTGDVIAAEEQHLVPFELGEQPRPDDQTLYRALFAYCDPLLRAQLLLRVLANASDVAALPAVPQDISAGVTYHFMHPRLRRIALGRLFRGGTVAPAPERLV